MRTPKTPVLDQSREYGRAFARIYDVVFPRDEAADRCAAVLAGLAREVTPRHPRAVELGIGTGRVAIPLARSGVRVHGVDSSPDLLELARKASVTADVDLDLVEADAREWRGDGAADLAYCVCATISMVTTVAEQRLMLAAAQSAVRPGGCVVVETHTPAALRAAHAATGSVHSEHRLGGTTITFRSTVAPGSEIWSLRTRWAGTSGSGTALEHSRLTEPDELIELARDEGLLHRDVWSDWNATAYDPTAPTYIAVFTNHPVQGRATYPVEGRATHRTPKE